MTHGIKLRLSPVEILIYIVSVILFCFGLWFSWGGIRNSAHRSVHGGSLVHRFSMLAVTISDEGFKDFFIHLLPHHRNCLFPAPFFRLTVPCPLSQALRAFFVSSRKSVGTKKPANLDVYGFFKLPEQGSNLQQLG